MNKILIIGKKSFLGSNLKKYLSKNLQLDNFSFEEIVRKKNSHFLDYSFIINTSIHPNYIKKKYNEKFDLDKRFINKFKKVGFKYIFLNSRKIYFQKENITERSLISPIDNYGKNKLITEKFLKNKLRSKLISLRISNIIGKRIFKNNRNYHKLFLDNFLIYKKKSKKIYVNNDFKDFITIEHFCKIMLKIIEKNISGIYNVSLSEKIFVSEITRWLDKNLYKNIKFTKPTKNSFTLSNKKLIKKIGIKLNKNQLRTFCKKLI